MKMFPWLFKTAPLTEIRNILTTQEDSVSKAVHFFLEIIARVISFEDQVGAIRQHLADIFEREQDWTKAALLWLEFLLRPAETVLGSITSWKPTSKFTRLYLEDEDHVNGEMYSSSSPAANTNQNEELQIRL